MAPVSAVAFALIGGLGFLQQGLGGIDVLLVLIELGDDFFDLRDQGRQRCLQRLLEELRAIALNLGAIIPSMNTQPEQPEDFARLYRRAFTQYGTRALWNKRELETPTPADALVIARALRVEGNRAARRLAEQIERACRAAL